MEKEIQTRKRGITLENTIYDVTLKLFDEEGVDEVTFYNIARLANTSRSVLYRRWTNPSSLLLAAVHHWAHKNSGYPEKIDLKNFPDMGSLRGDLIENARRNAILYDSFSKYLVKFSMYRMANGENISDDILVDAEEGAIALGKCFAQRAIKRGELETVPTKEVLMLLGNLRRYYTFVAPNSAPTIEELIDNIVLPAWLASKK
ncbi:TetR/AcrR family transcriptional regulator [Leuconostoc gasicomitatum]|uniref:Helix-turn-helix transcriptional regulator n=1 Tax=Leuconostoc gasicomitatum TaxID=115778 RepID=A0A9Q3SYS7_9LACO|nr:TetR/AcrR family transcriptional regulator [Leuconostoc gasicomitatum]MBZ5962529.1 helix-turn-helix transcriptional regulator [Leuconostoc gasicomitatum]